jgi:hypothetical protein
VRLRWPPSEPAHHDYEILREAALAGNVLDDEREARFETWGLAGLISHVRSLPEPTFRALWVGAHRPPWTPYSDPRLDCLVRTFGILFGTSQPNVDSIREDS